MSNITKERREYLLNNLLLFMKNEMEDCEATIDTYWFVVKFPEEVYIMGVSEPVVEPASEDTAKFIAKCPCSQDELKTVLKYAIAHEFLEKQTYNEYKITYSGFNKAEDYEEYLEQNITDNEIILNNFVISKDNQVNEMVIKSRNLFLTKDLDGALEKIWDAFERIKTILTPDKKKGSKELCETCATSLSFNEIESEFSALTNIGNNYMIRHSETTKKPIKDVNTKVFLYYRMLSLVTFAIKQMENIGDDL